MKKTVLITGSSSGIGKSTALYFQKQGWNVVATMRSPEKEKELTKYSNIIVLPLDVTKADSITSAIQKTIQTFGGIDVVINNAGYGLRGPFEATTEDQIKQQFETNVFGLMSVVREILPYFREKRNGIIINVASMGGRLTVPLYSVYHSTKWAVDGYSESLHFELLPYNIKIKIIEPGAIKTDFYNRSAQYAEDPKLNTYDAYVKKAMENMDKNGEKGASPQLVAKTIYKAATSNSSRLRYPVGSDAKSLLFLRRFISDNMYSKLVRAQLLK